MSERTEGAQGHDENEIHMPPNSYWPLVAAIGTAWTLFGIVSILKTPIVFIIGLVILIIGVGGWIRDARTEYNELH